MKNKNFGRIPVISERISKECGYDKKFRYNIDMQSNGIPGECIDWCEKNCAQKWGWWFESTDLYDTAWHNWEEQRAYMSFTNKKEAMKFFIACGIKHIGNENV